MRIWHYELLPYLPERQFKGQLRELVAIMKDLKYKKQTNHVLINKVMEYPHTQLSKYYLIYRDEYYKRYGKVVNENYSADFMHFAPTAVYWGGALFEGWHTKEYLRSNYANLWEKHFMGVGKSRISDDEWQTLLDGYRQITGEDYVI